MAKTMLVPPKGGEGDDDRQASPPVPLPESTNCMCAPIDKNHAPDQVDPGRSKTEGQYPVRHSARSAPLALPMGELARTQRGRD